MNVLTLQSKIQSTPLLTVDAKIKRQSYRWDEILTEPYPTSDRPYSIGVWHFGRGMAFAAKGQCEAARAELKQLRAIAQRSRHEIAKHSRQNVPQSPLYEIDATANLLSVAVEILASKLATQRGNDIEAKKHLKTALRLISGDS